MPREKKYVDVDSTMQVGWGNHEVQLGVGIGKPFVMLGETEVFDSFWITINDEEIDWLIKKLLKAKRKTK